MKVTGSSDRADQMRKRRADAARLRDVSPGTACVSVQLEFLPASAPPHAAQSFVLYPPAHAFFEYPCPYGGCDGIYDVSTAAEQVLRHQKKKVAGTIECSGTRARDGSPKQACGLSVHYSVSIERAD